MSKRDRDIRNQEASTKIDEIHQPEFLVGSSEEELAEMAKKGADEYLKALRDMSCPVWGVSYKIVPIANFKINSYYSQDSESTARALAKDKGYSFAINYTVEMDTSD